jgi:hypothetical protein
LSKGSAAQRLPAVFGAGTMIAFTITDVMEIDAT